MESTEFFVPVQNYVSSIFEEKQAMSQETAGGRAMDLVEFRAPPSAPKQKKEATNTKLRGGGVDLVESAFMHPIKVKDCLNKLPRYVFYARFLLWNSVNSASPHQRRKKRHRQESSEKKKTSLLHLRLNGAKNPPRLRSTSASSRRWHRGI